MSYPIKLENGSELWIALSLKQPWASMIAVGRKTIETRRWFTRYRGGLLICASKTVDTAAWEHSPKLLPTGVAVCVAELVDCRPMTTADEEAACCEVYPRAYAWVLENIRKIKPFPMRGQLCLFEVEVPGGVIAAEEELCLT